MYQIADNQLIGTMDLLTVIQSLWNGMAPFLGVMHLYAMHSAS